MKLPTDAHLALIQEGRLTMQVPEWSIGPAKMRAAVGREEGWTYLSWHGFIHYLVDLKKAFNSRQQRGHSWDDVLVHAIEFYKDVKKRSQDHLIRLEAEVQIKPTPYNKKRVAEMQAALRKL